MTSPEPSPTELKLHDLANQALAGLVVVIVFVILGSSFLLWQAYKVGEQGERLQAVAVETHTALCVLKQDSQRRRQAATDFLRDNPAGISGIPRSVIVQAVENYTLTLDALSILDCS